MRLMSSSLAVVKKKVVLVPCTMELTWKFFISSVQSEMSSAKRVKKAVKFSLKTV